MNFDKKKNEVLKTKIDIISFYKLNTKTKIKIIGELWSLSFINNWFIFIYFLLLIKKTKSNKNNSFEKYKNDS